MYVTCGSERYLMNPIPPEIKLLSRKMVVKPVLGGVLLFVRVLPYFFCCATLYYLHFLTPFWSRHFLEQQSPLVAHFLVAVKHVKHCLGGRLTLTRRHTNPGQHAVVVAVHAVVLVEHGHVALSNRIHPPSYSSCWYTFWMVSECDPAGNRNCAFPTNGSE